jgi:hypothetical protein
MRIKTRLQEIEKDPELMGLAACVLLFLLLVLYKIGTWVGALSYERFG